MGILLSCFTFSEQSDIDDPTMFLDKLKLQVTQKKEELEQLKAQTLEQENELEAMRGQNRGHIQAIEEMRHQLQDVRTLLQEQEALFGLMKTENQLLKQEIATTKTRQQKRIKDIEAFLLPKKQENHTAAKEHGQDDKRSEVTVNALEQKPEGFHNLVTTTFVWRLAPFEQLVKKARMGKQYLLNSDPFYTGRHGYKMRVKLYPNGYGTAQGTHVSAYIVLMKGEYDAILPWPFERKVKVSIIDQDDNLADRKNIVGFFRVKDPIECFGRPVSGDNDAYGFRKLASLEYLETRKFIVGGNMFVRVDIMDK